MTEDEMVGCITDSMDMSLGKLWELVVDRETLAALLRVRTRPEFPKGNLRKLA